MKLVCTAFSLLALHFTLFPTIVESKRSFIAGNNLTMYFLKQFWLPMFIDKFSFNNSFFIFFTFENKIVCLLNDLFPDNYISILESNILTSFHLSLQAYNGQLTDYSVPRVKHFVHV